MKLVIFLLLCCLLIQGLAAFRVVCVYTNWSQYRPDIGKFVPEDVDPSLCTHLVYVYAKLKGNKLIPTEWNDDGNAWSEGMFQRVQNLKQLNPELKTLLGVGGWMMGSKDFSRMASRLGSRRMFATSTVKFLRERDFDGLTIDWQYPTKRGGKPYDRKNFSLLLKEVNKAFQDESRRSQLPPLLLTVGVAGGREIIDSAYEFDNLTRYTDFINVMAYDLHGPWDNYTGHPSQLYARQEEFGPSTEINVDAVMRHWISNIPDRSKLVLGVSTYGRSFTLRKQRHNEYNVPTIGPGLAGEYTKQPGMLAFYERCSQYADATRVWDDQSKVSYWYRGDQWLAGEDVESIKAKVRWVKQHRTGGITVQALDTDDFYNTCSFGPYPLLTALNDEISAPFVPITTTTSLYVESTTTAVVNLDTGITEKSTIATTRTPTIAVSKISKKVKPKTNAKGKRKPSGKTKMNSAKISQKKKIGNKNKKTQTQPKRVLSRNDNPNNKKQKSNVQRKGNRIIVRKVNNKNVSKTGVKSNQQKKKGLNKVDKKSRITIASNSSNSNGENKQINKPGKDISEQSIGLVSVKNNKSEEPSINKNEMKDTKKIAVQDKKPKEQPSTINTETNSSTSQKDIKTEKGNKSQSVNNTTQKPTKKSARKKPQPRRRRKLTKKQMDILRRRRNRQKQLQLKKKREQAKTKQ